MVGETISRYKITQRLGAGGMGEVFAAEDEKLGRRVALKFLSTSDLADDDVRARFLHEARAAAALDHPNICGVYEIDEERGRHFMAMPLLEGESLDKRIERGPLPFPDLIEIAIQTAEALEEAHSKGVVHRDIKPPNVMVQEKGPRLHCVLMDFGLARLAQSARLTREGSRLGTAAYMSPEQVQGTEVDSRTDIWALGVVMYEMAAGTLPFPSDYEQALFYGILNDQPEPLTGLRTGLPVELERIVMKCLAKEPAERYQSCTDLMVDLQALKRALEKGSAETRAPQPVAASSPEPERRASSFATVATGLAGLLIGAGVMWWASQPPPEGKWTPTYEVEQLTWDSGLSVSPELSGDGGIVAYASDRDGGGQLDIWVQQTSGGGSVQITDSAEAEWNPAFSPDGSTIAFQRGPDIYLVAALGGSARPFARSAMLPSYSPDGETLAYKSSQHELFVQPLDGGGPRQLASGITVATKPIWAPDGAHLLFIGIEDSELRGGQTDEWEFWAVPLDGAEPVATGLRRYVEAETEIHNLSNSPVWLVPGSELVFSSYGHLLRLDFSTETWEARGRPEYVTFGPAKLDTPSVASDGTIAGHSAQRHTDIWRLSLRDLPDSQFSWALDPEAEAYYPHLSEDGRLMVYLAQAGDKTAVHLRDLTTGEDRPITDDSFIHRAAALSPDGTQVAFQSIDGGVESLRVHSVETGESRTVCEECGRPKSWSDDHRYVLVEADTPNVAKRVDIATGDSTTLLEVESAPVHDPQFSPDGAWIVFKVHWSEREGQIFVAPYRNAQQVPQAEWTELTKRESFDRKPRWSPRGDRVYFLSGRGEGTSLWSVEWNRRRARAGEPRLERTFEDTRYSMRDLQGYERGFDVGPDFVYLTRRETTGQIYLLRPYEPPQQ